MRDDARLNALFQAYQTWDYESYQLSPGAAFVITTAVSLALPGVDTGISGTLTTVAMKALVQQASVLFLRTYKVRYNVGRNFSFTSNQYTEI